MNTFVKNKCVIGILFFVVIVITNSFLLAADTWEDLSTWSNPIDPLVTDFKSQIASMPAPTPTGVSCSDYLDKIEVIIDYWLPLQSSSGNVGSTGGTVCYALGAATLYAYHGRTDLLESAALAVDWTVNDLTYGSQDHAEFQIIRVLPAIDLLQGYVTSARYQSWLDAIEAFDPWTGFTRSMGANNWNMIALAGEFAAYHKGLRANLDYVEQSVDANGYRFTSRWGLYEDPHSPMAYDHFARIWVDEMMFYGDGYKGSHAADLKEVLRRAALTGMFMQSSTGQLPAGGRSNHHHWNEGMQCMVQEIYARHALDAGDTVLAGMHKRSAHIALQALDKWIQPEYAMNPVRNYFDASLRFGFAPYGGTAYNLTMVSTLALAYKHALYTETVAEQYAPCEVGGFVVHFDDHMHKIFANAAGMYIEIDTNADFGYNPTGLIRIHKIGTDPEIGPSDGLVSNPKYNLPSDTKINAAVGVSWQNASGTWKRLAEYHPTSVTVQNVLTNADRVSFDVVYLGSFDGVTSVTEKYVITPENVEMTAVLGGYTGSVRFVWPILFNDGRNVANISVLNPYFTWVLAGNSQCYKAIGATDMWVGDTQYPYRNGYARLGYAEFINTNTAQMLLGFDLKGDLDKNSTVDNIDLMLFCSAWLLADTVADIYPNGGDGIVDMQDFGQFASTWIGPDNTAPEPATMTWAMAPAALNSSTIEMTAATATDKSGVEYYFYNVTDPDHDSGWQTNVYYKDTGLNPSTEYVYRVVARDLSSNQNQNSPSALASATTTPFVGITVFETFDTNPTDSGWINAQAGSTVFTYNASGYLDAALYKQSTPARYYTELPNYDKTTELWWEYDCQFLSSSGTWGNALLGSFAAVSGDYEFVGTRFGTKKTAGNRYDLWYQTSSAAYTLFIGPETIPDNTSVRIKGHYWYADGIGYAQMDVYNISTGISYGTTGVQQILDDGSSFINNIFGIGNRTDGSSTSPTNVKIDNLYFSTEGANASPAETSFN